MTPISKIACLAALSASSVFAGTISYNAGPFGPATTDFTGALNLQKFNLAGQILTGVTLTLNVSEDITSVGIANNSGSVQSNFEVFTTSKITTSGTPDLIPNFVLNLFDSGIITLGNTGGACAASTPTANCQNVSYNPFSVAGSGSVNASASNFGFYTGAGTFALSGTTKSLTTFDGGGANLVLTQATKGTLNATVTYTYAASTTPEPATMTLFGTALLGIGFFARKRSKKS